jgi:acid phosphatase type 7
MEHRTGFMRVLGFSGPGYCLSIALLTGLLWISLGPAAFAGTLDVALAASDPVIAAAGDIACDPTSTSFNGGAGNQVSCRQQYTSDLLVDADLAAVLPLGDVQYYCGGYRAFLQSYDASWGRVKSISHPVVGNHEYLTYGGTDCTSDNAGAEGYFKYFGEAAGEPSRGYYSYEIGAWHLIALNSNCGDADGCGPTSPQGRWLLADLAKHRNLCTLAYWHIPLFSSGGRAASNTDSLWQILYNAEVDVILNGHDHIYERFAPQAPDGTLDRDRGIRQFTVGTGGANLTELERLAANSEVRDTDTYGVLKLTLHADSYDWQFVPEAGKTFTDSGTDKCHGETSPANTLAITPTPTQTVPPTPATTAFTFPPTADAYISKTRPTLNFGASNMLRLYGGPLGASYLRFDVQGLPGSVTRATLRLYANSESRYGYQVRTVTNDDWDDSTITYENAPPIGGLIALSEPFHARQWTHADLTSLVKGDGTYSIVLITFNRVPLSLASRDAVAAYRPQLVVEVVDGANSIPATETFNTINSAE